MSPKDDIRLDHHGLKTQASTRRAAQLATARLTGLDRLVSRCACGAYVWANDPCLVCVELGRRALAERAGRRQAAA